MASLFSPGMNVAHDVRPRKGAMGAWSTLIGTSFLGLLILKVLSFSFRIPFKPVMDSIFAVSRPGSAAPVIDALVQRNPVHRPAVTKVENREND